MGEHYKRNPCDFAEFMQSVVQLNALQKMTQDLDKELSDSQNIMMEIKAIYDTVSIVQNNQPEPVNNVLHHEDISKFLEASCPKLLMSDMAEDNMDVDIDDIIASVKSHAEDLKKNFTIAGAQPPKPLEFVKLNLDQYAQSLDQLSKRMANIKLNKKDELNNRNIELEGKLEQICDDVNKFTTMVQAKTVLDGSNKTHDQGMDTILQYDSIISKLLSGLNEVTYLLQNKN